MRKFAAVFALIMALFAAPAFAANPFMDVPAGHWAYDAVAQLAARGVVSGYPDGAYKGAQPATRYEMASVVARAMTRIDMEKASRQDVEIMKRLMLEFKDELDALGVKVDQIDKRVAKLEEGIGGWKIRGTFVFDAKFSGGDQDESTYTTDGRKNEFSKEEFRLFLTKTIDENTYFYAEYRTGGDDAGDGDGRGDMQHGIWSHLFVDTMLPWDMNLRVGRFDVDFEGDYGLYIDNDALFGDFRTDGFRLSKSWGGFTGTAIVGRNDDYTDEIYGDAGMAMTYALDLNWTPSEKFFLGATGYWMIEDSAPFDGDWDVNTYGVYGGYNFTDAIALKGVYYFQDLGSDVAAGLEDSPKAWKAILDVQQDALKFTSLWLEYSQQDNNFWSPVAAERYSIGGSAAGSIGLNMIPNDNTSKWIFVQATQEWTEKWSTFLRYATVDYDTAGIADADEWGVGVGYQYTPAIYFELMYDQVDFGEGTFNTYSDKDHVFRFKTSISF